MSFTTNLFLTVFMPVTIFFSVLFRKHINRQNIFILLMNVVLLLFSGIGGILFLFITCVVDYFIIRGMLRTSKKKVSTIIFVFAIFLNIWPLIIFKYTGFALSSVNAFFHLTFSIPQWSVPIGISFYTFQAISLLADIKLGKITYQPKFIDICFYLSFFTTITSGPITRFDVIHRQLHERNITAECINHGITRFVIGLGKKVILANTLALFVEDVFACTSTNSLSILAYWMGALAFTLQLYLDFSGYSDMAIGISQILGFRIPENFDYPYTSRNISEFWRKWHISLSQWFRDYIYIPLGGNRVSIPRHIFNLFIVWLLTGIWHGANWTFICWGLLYFVVLIFEKYCKPVAKFLKNHFIGHVYTMFVVNLLWVLFRADSIHSAGVFISRMFGFDSFGIPIEKSTLHIIPFVLISFICCYPIGKLFGKHNGKFLFEALKIVFLCCITIISILFISNLTFEPFIYGKF